MELNFCFWPWITLLWLLPGFKDSVSTRCPSFTNYIENKTWLQVVNFFRKFDSNKRHLELATKSCWWCFKKLDFSNSCSLYKLQVKSCGTQTVSYWLPVEKVIQKVWQNSHEIICIAILESFFSKVSGLTCNFTKTRPYFRCLPTGILHKEIGLAKC